MLPRIPSIVMRRYSTAPGMASAGTCINRSIHGPSRNPMTVQRQRRCKQQPDRGAHELFAAGHGRRGRKPPAIRGWRCPSRLPTKTQSRISSGWGAGHHRCQRRSVAEIANDERVHRAVQQLQDIAGADGQRKQRRAPRHRPWVISTCAGFSVRRHSPIPRHDRFSYPILYEETVLEFATIIIL